MALVPRHELKYLISAHDAQILKTKISHLLKPDKNSCVGASYKVISLYFDSPDFLCAQEKEGGYYDRFKYRLRTYNNGGVYNLELKKKRGDACLKTIHSLDKETAFSLIEGSVLPAEKTAGFEKFYSLRRSTLIKPAVVVRYKRTAFCGDAGRVRITFDEDLCAASASPMTLQPPVFYTEESLCVPILPPGFSILEIKYDSFFPDYLKSILTLSSRPQLSVSKYVLCLKAVKGL
jgi:hypothetical protein